MKRQFLAGLTFTLLTFFCVNCFAQGPRNGQGMHRKALIPECSTLERLDLSPGQREALQQINEHYKDRILRNRNHIMVKRLELRGLLRDPHAGKEAIQAKSREMGALREALQKDMIDYQIQVREILTPEQIRRWCTMMGQPQGGWKGDSWCR